MNKNETIDDLTIKWINIATKGFDGSRAGA